MIPGAGALRETGNRITMDMLVQFLTQSVDRTVVDRTGLGGLFRFHSRVCARTRTRLPTRRHRRRIRSFGVSIDLHSPSGTARAETRSQKGPVDVLVIDYVEKPSPN